MNKLAVSGMLNQKGLLAVSFEKRGANFFKDLNLFLDHAGFMHAHVGVDFEGKRELWLKPGQEVDRFHHLTHSSRDDHQAFVISGAKHVFVIFTPVTELMRSRVLGALKLYARPQPHNKAR